MKVKSFLKEIYTKLKKHFKIVFKFLENKKYVFLMCLPFFAMDIITRFFGSDIGFFKIYRLVPNLFTIIWVLLFVTICLSFKKHIAKWIYLFISLVFVGIFLTNNIYYSMTATFFDFSLLESASEGSPYIIDTIKNANVWIYISLIPIILLVIVGFKNIPPNKTNNFKFLIECVLVFVIAHIFVPYLLGSADKELTWSTWKNPRNVYISYSDNNKSLKVSGLYEYTFRNFYINFLKTDMEENAEEIEFLENAFQDSLNKENKYTGKFKGMNLMFIQLEGIDNWLLTKEDTPTLYKMQKEGINFSNHYSYYNGGGSTFNSEFSVNTGFITPLSYTKNAYSFNKNSFPNSMANIFKDLGYSVNAFHMNTGEYYSRSTNYHNWGYDNYYGLIDMYEYKDSSYKLDREMILNTEYSNLMFPENSNFVDYIITYSNHLPFSNTNKKSVCKQLFDLDNETLEESADTIMNEEECARRQSKETDYMMKLLLQTLKNKGLYDNTVIIVFTDHYLYTLEDMSILDKYKTTTNNLINETPFFIWSSKTKSTTIKSVTSQLNILPTTLNLFGVDYNPNNYIGNDALDSKYSGIVFFDDYSWYDGKVYVVDGINTSKKKISSNNLEEKNYFVSYITKKNDLALKYNYFRK